jgi:FdhE protein
MTAKRVVAEPTEIGTAAQPPFVRLPDIATLFERRAQRLETLAAGNPLADYLRFTAAICRAQAAAARALPAGKLPGAGDIAFCHENKLPLIDRMTWRRDASWHAALDGIVGNLGAASPPAAAKAALDALSALDADGREARADSVLGIDVAQADPTWADPAWADPTGADPASACFVHAALQVYWARMAALLDAAAVQRVDSPVVCPVCGSPPLASVLFSEGTMQGTRFLSCPLCASQWHYVRIKCANCTSTKGIAYQHVAEQSDAIKAETCNECGTYTKIVYLEKEPAAEPFADDLATVALDILVGEAGWARATPHPFLVPAST